MRIKAADDKSKRVALLEDLQQSPKLDPYQKKWLQEELLRLRRGIEGEKEAAHYIDTHFRDAENHVVLHDLRISVDGEVAQIDHLIIARMFSFYLLETKNFGGNLSINEVGEFTVEYGKERFGIPSPLEQSRRHEAVLARLLEKLGITGRTQKRPQFHHAVLLHPRAIIHRPDAKIFDTSNVIKADQFDSWRSKMIDKIGFGTVLAGLMNLHSLDTIKEWGEMLKRQHHPADLLALPDFMKPKELSSPSTSNQQPPSAQPCTAHPLTPVNEENRKRLICSTCGCKISFAEGKFCWNNPKRFGEQQYCREHQQQFR